MNKGVSFDITPIEETAYGIKYRITVEGPMIGWYDNMYFVIENEQGRSSYKLNHQKNKDGRVYFASDVFLETRAMYRYYFSYFLDGKHHFIKNKELAKDDIYRDEMFKVAVDFKVPDWVKGKIMYHIFLDRFNRGSNEPLTEMPRRHIHKSWDEQMQIGPDKDGIYSKT